MKYNLYTFTVWIKITIVIFFIVSYYILFVQINTYKIQFHVNILDNTSHQGELYYSNDIDTYDEYHKKKFQYKDGEVSLSITSHHINYIRLDPLIHSGTIQIKNLYIKSKTELQKINFNNIKYTHNIKILEQNSTTIKVLCIDEDPYLIFNDKITLNKINLQTVTSILLITFLFSSILYILLFLVQKYTLSNISLIFLLLLYSIYVLLFSSWSLAQDLLILFFMISFLISLIEFNQEKIAYIKQVVIFLSFYFILSYGSIVLATPYANINYLYEKTLPIILASFIPIGFYKMRYFNLKFYKISLTTLFITFSILMILFNMNIISINNINLFELTMQRNAWTQKNYTFWYLLLMFGTISFYNTSTKKDITLIIGMIVIAYFSIFYAYSHSAKLAFIIGISIYTILSLFHIKKNILLILIWIMTLYIILSPLLFSLIDLSSYHHKLVYRNYLYHISSSLIKEHWLFGYGYGSTLNISFSDILNIAKSDLPYENGFRGGHPHNLSLLFWLEFGIFGATFLAYFIHKFLKNIIEISYGKTNHAALFGMIFAFEVITSFSWDIWYPQVLLTYAFFAILISLSLNIKLSSRKTHV